MVDCVGCIFRKIKWEAYTLIVRHNAGVMNRVVVFTKDAKVFDDL